MAFDGQISPWEAFWLLRTKFAKKYFDMGFFALLYHLGMIDYLIYILEQNFSE